MRETKEFICIVCPFGCRLKVETEEGAVAGVAGNICARGREYAHKEATAPERLITSMVRLANRDKPVSVKTTKPVPKQQFFQCVQAIRAARPAAPLACGQVVLPNVCGTGVDVVATQDVE